MKQHWIPSEAEQIAWLEGRLDDKRAASMQAWLNAHPEQRAELEQIQALDADLQDFPQPAFADAELDMARLGVMQQLRQLEQEPHGDLRHPAAEPARRREDAVRRFNLQWIPAAVAALIIGFVFGRRDDAPLSSMLEPAPDLARTEGFHSIDGREVAFDGRSMPRGRQVAVKNLAVQPDERVSIELSETSSYELNGLVSDRDIQGALGFVLRNDQDPDRRRQAIQLLDEQCEGQELCQILVYALTQDPNPDVRREAAQALRDDSSDPLVRRSFLKMLVEDPSPELRGLAGEVLSGKSPTTEFGK